MTSIRVPEIYWFDNNPENPVGAEYILMEKMKGVPLAEKWESMSNRDHMKIIDQVLQMEKELADIKFPAYGSLFPRNLLPDEMFKHHLLPSTLDPKESLCIGPSCDANWWYLQSEDGMQAKSETAGPCKSNRTSMGSTPARAFLAAD